MRISPIIIFDTSKDVLHAVKSYDIRPPALLSIRRKVCCGCLSPLKNPSPRSCLKSLHLGQVANTVTTTPPRWLYNKALSAEFITFYLDTLIYVVSLVGMINENIVRFIHTLLYNSSLYKFWPRSYRKGLKNTKSVYWRFTYADSAIKQNNFR
jgi:hypothetical protein